MITTDDQTLFSGGIEGEPRDDKQDQVVRELILDPHDMLLWKICGFQCGKSWQPFGEGKNGRKDFRQVRTYLFCDKRVIFVRNYNFNPVHCF